MFTFETSDQKEVRRFRIAQFNGRTATVRSAASARWLSNVLGLIFIRKAPCLLEQPSLIRLSTSRSRLVNGFWPVSGANIWADLRAPSAGRRARASLACLQAASEASAG